MSKEIQHDPARRDFLKKSALVSGAAIAGTAGFVDLYSVMKKGNTIQKQSEEEVQAQGIKPQDPEKVRKAKAMAISSGRFLMSYQSTLAIQRARNVIAQQANYDAAVRKRFHANPESPSRVRKNAGVVLGIGGGITSIAKVKDLYQAYKSWCKPLREQRENQ
jgi:hypothetical protein